MSTNTKEKQNRRLAASSPPATGRRARSLRESLGGWVAAGSGRLQGRGGGAAHLVAEEAGEAALGRGGARRREPAHVPEAQRAIVRGRVQHLAVHLRTRGVGLSATPPPARARHSHCPCSYEINHAQALLCSQRRLCMPGHRRECQLPRPTDGGGERQLSPEDLGFREEVLPVVECWGRGDRPAVPPSLPRPPLPPGQGGASPLSHQAAGPRGQPARAPTWMQLMIKAWPRNTLCSAPDWASKARARASPLPVNTVDTRATGPPAREPSTSPGRRRAGAGRADSPGPSPGPIRPPYRDVIRFKWGIEEAP